MCVRITYGLNKIPWHTIVLSANHEGTTGLVSEWMNFLFGCKIERSAVQKILPENSGQSVEQGKKIDTCQQHCSPFPDEN